MRTSGANQSHLPLVLIGTLIAISPWGVSAQTASDTSNQTILVADGTPIHLILMDDLQGKKLHARQPVHFKVRQDLVVDSKLVVKTGAEAIGHIESVSRGGLFGKSGKLVLQFDYVTSTSGAIMSLKGGTGVSGGKGGALTVLSATWYGPDANLPVGTIINAYINHDQRFPLR